MNEPSPPDVPSPRTATLEEFSESHVEPLMAVGKAIWIAYYTPMLGAAQVAYMTGQRFTGDYLRGYLHASNRWLRVLKFGGHLIGYCSYALTATPGELKLEQLYLLPEYHGRGLGGLMMRHVEVRARELGCTALMLQVNKHNANSIAVYRRRGFTVREEAVFDIGAGFVMDDYVMEKRLH